MANQTLILNVSDEMKLDNDRGILCEESGVEELCSSSLDTTEELYSSSVPDTCGMRHIATKGEVVKILDFTHFSRVFKFNKTSEIGRKKKIFHEIKVSVVMELV